MLPVPGGTVNVIVVPTFCCPLAIVASSDSCTARWQVLGCGVVSGGPTTGVGAVPFGVHDGDALGDRHSPFEQLSAGFTALQSVVHAAKQNEPVEVLTHELPVGQVLWSAGLHAAVHAPPANSGPVPQISPAVHCVFGHALASVVLAGRFCAGQFAAGTQALNPGQQV